MAPLTLKATIRPPGNRLILTCEDAAGRRLEIRTIVSNPTIRIDGGAPILLSDPQLQAGGAAVVYELPERIGPDDTVMLDAPIGWALTANGAVPALAPLKVENSAVAPGRLEVQKPISLNLISASVLASGRALKLVFASDDPPADLATFVDRHRSRIGELVLHGAKTRNSLQFAGCSVARGQNDVYILDTGPGTIVGDTSGTSLSFYQGETLLGTIPSLTNTSEKQQVALSRATGGTFTLTLEGKTTGAIAFNANAATVQAAIGKSGITVSGPAGGPWTVTFGGSYKNSDRAEIVADGSALTGTSPAIAVTVIQEGVDAIGSLRDQLRTILGQIPIPSDSLSDSWFLWSYASDYRQTPAKNGPQSYTLTVSDGTTSYTTDPIPYTNIASMTDIHNAVNAANALNAKLGADCVIGFCPNQHAQDIQLVFRRNWGCPIWPITSVTVNDASDPALLEPDGERDAVLVQGPGGRVHTSLSFYNALGCRDFDLSMTASDPSQGIVLKRLIQGDHRYRWNVFFYLDNPAEVITFQEALTISAPAGWLAGSAPTTAHPEGEATGDQTAAFDAVAVTNRSWAGPDGDLSPDLCHIADPANGVDDGWSRWRTESPPDAWKGNPNAPIRIAYVDPVNGNNSTAQINDPTRPFQNFAQGAMWNTWIGSNAADITAAWDRPKLVLIKKGTEIVGGASVNWPAVVGTYEAPVIISTYWMTADGPEPSPYATISQARTVLDTGPTPYLAQNNVIHGLVLNCSWTTQMAMEDFAIWDCVCPPTVNSPDFVDFLNLGQHVHRGSLVRGLIYDRWTDILQSGGGKSVFVQGVYGSKFYDMMFDQCTFLRNGYIGLTDGFDGGPKSYMSLLGNDPAATLGSPYRTVFVHDIYSSSNEATPILLFNTYGGQGVGAAYNARAGCVMYGCVRYGDSDLGVSPCGDPDSSRASSSHIRRNLFLRSGGLACIRIGTWKSLEVVGSTVNVVEDNLVLEPARQNISCIGIGTSDLGVQTNCQAIVVRQNTLVDQCYAWVGQNFAGIAGATVPPDRFRLAVARNLAIRTSDFPADNTVSLLGRLLTLTAWPGMQVANNLYLASGGSRAADFLDAGGASVGFAGWQALGLDAGSHYMVQDFTPAMARPAGGRDVLVDHLARFQPLTVTDAASALSVLRDRRPGIWDDDLYTPLGTDGGILKTAESAYQPTDLIQGSLAPNGYFGALDYTATDNGSASPKSGRALKWPPPRRKHGR